MRIVFKIFFFLLFVFANASRCPETRKPHVTSCVIFYNCINLPEGGYVWAPSKCSDGLVFQPLLRLCVLPGDTWTCDNELDHSSIDEQTFHTSELIDKTKTSYDGLITNDMVYSADSSRKTDTLSNLGNELSILPYPLIEFDEKHKINPDPSPMIPIKRLTDDLLHMNHAQEYIPVTLIEVKDEEKKMIPNLKSFINRLFLYQYFAPSLNHQTFVSSPSINHSILSNNEHHSNDVWSYLIENYIRNRNSDDLEPINQHEIIMKVKTTTEKVESSPEHSNSISTTEKQQIDVENIDQLNNVLAINGNLGRKEYVTVEKYKSWPNDINIKILQVIPCIRAQRLPNATDCMRYYTCDPTTAEIHEFICPPNTAFNNQINLCDTQKYKLCKENRKSMEFEKIPNTMELQKIIVTNKLKHSETVPAFKLCETTGKFADITSDKFYYLCYSSKNSGKIESYRMACPNNLIFCQDRNVCTAKQFCSNFK